MRKRYIVGFIAVFLFVGILIALFIVKGNVGDKTVTSDQAPDSYLKILQETDNNSGTPSHEFIDRLNALVADENIQDGEKYQAYKALGSAYERNGDFEAAKNNYLSAKNLQKELGSVETEVRELDRILLLLDAKMNPPEFVPPENAYREEE